MMDKMDRVLQDGQNFTGWTGFYRMDRVLQDEQDLIEKCVNPVKPCKIMSIL